jgi:hypothetical protein
MRYRIEFSTVDELEAKVKILRASFDIENYEVGKFKNPPDYKALNKYLGIKEIKNAPKRTSPNTKTNIV